MQQFDLPVHTGLLHTKILKRRGHITLASGAIRVGQAAELFEQVAPEPHAFVIEGALRTLPLQAGLSSDLFEAVLDNLL